jgi:hypothetical protein
MNKLFPGMDPYLEDPAFWADFHLTFIGCWREAIADVLPEPYEARLDETIQLVPMSEEVIQLIYPDVAVSRARKREKLARRQDAATAVLEPVVIPHELVEEVRQARIQILHRPDRSLVTVVEMLSPANKTGEGFADFCAKRVAILRQKVHLVELDLLLGGRRLPLSKPLPPGDYYAMLSRSDKRPDCEVFAWTLRQALPVLPIPLRDPDADVLIDLGAVFKTAYGRGRYARSLPYSKPPRAPMKKTDKQWATERSKGK